MASGVDPRPRHPRRAARRGHLNGVEAPYPQLHDLVDEAFQAFRLRLAKETGWDLLSTLENAFVPLTAPLAPGEGKRGFIPVGHSPLRLCLLTPGGWPSYVKIWVSRRTGVFMSGRAYQDGSQGKPLLVLPWDFSARSSGAIRAYEDGGAFAEGVSPGYWVDFTSIAAAYGWERQPALNNWRTFYQGARVNEFAMTGGIDWESAMLELYPPEVLITPTIIIPPTRTPTITPRWYRTPTPSTTPTSRPTMTPSPGP